MWGVIWFVDGLINRDWLKNSKGVFLVMISSEKLGLSRTVNLRLSIWFAENDCWCHQQNHSFELASSKEIFVIGFGDGLIRCDQKKKARSKLLVILHFKTNKTLFHPARKTEIEAGEIRPLRTKSKSKEIRPLRTKSQTWKVRP